MGESKLVIISHHVILPHVQESVSAALFVEGQVITGVRQPTLSLEEAKGSYPGWTILDYSDFYISPGLIDLNVYNCPPWECREQTSLQALSGGVTFYLEESSLYTSLSDTTPAYCDIGKVERITGLCDFRKETEAFAYKVYLYPPSSGTMAVGEALEEVFDRVIGTPLPLFVDCSLPQARMLYMASPYRHSSLEERLAAVYVDESAFGSGAYQEDEVLSSESGSEEVYSKPNRCHSSVEECIHDQTPRRTTATTWEKFTGKSRPRGHTEDLEELSMPDSSLPTIISDLNKRIDNLQESQCDLIASEQHTYDQAGKYIYSESPTLMNDSPPCKIPICNSSSKLRIVPAQLLKKSRMRPKPLNLEKCVEEQEAKEKDYVYHLGSCPDHWEIAGVEKVLKALRRAPCRVHFTNVSSAAAVNKVRIFKEQKLSDSVSVETTPHYLFFTKDDVQLSDTRLKTFPPIRNRSNCNLLWELLKVKAIDVIASHHISVPRELKFRDSGNFKKALNGIKCVGAGLNAVWTKLLTPSASSPSVWERYLVRLAKWMSLNPARLIGIGHKRGSIGPGKFADFIIWSPFSPTEIKDEDCPYAHKRLFGHIEAVYIRGQLAFSKGSSVALGQVMSRSDFY